MNRKFLSPPSKPLLPCDNHITILRDRIIKAIEALPFYFDSDTFIEGIEAGDLFSLNTVLGSTIEVQTVKALNKLRSIWDPEDKYKEYSFYRSSQSFPDVRFVDAISEDAKPLIGLELKGWYLLSKEKVPTFRFSASEGACTDFDLIVVIPWYLKNVLSGKPEICAPIILGAKWASQMRTYYWQNMRDTEATTEIVFATDAEPYPKASRKISDKAVSDNGGNFGRLARIDGLMNEEISNSLCTPISGIAASYWIDFFSAFVDNVSNTKVEKRLKEAINRVVGDNNKSSTEELEKAISELTGSIYNIAKHIE